MNGIPVWACPLALGLSAGVFAGAVWLSVRRTIRAAGMLADSARRIAAGELPRDLGLDSSGTLGPLAQALTEIAEQMRDAADAQSQLEADHAAELEQRDRLLETLIRTAGVAAGATGQQVLIEATAEQLAVLWPRYSVGLYLLDDGRTTAVLGAEAHVQNEGVPAHRPRVPVGDGTTVGQCLASGEVRAWPEMDQSTVYADRAFQAGARPELAVPVRSKGHLLGAISVYSDRLEAFDPSFVAAVHATGDQLACALETLRLAQTVQEARTGMTIAAASTEQAWKELTQTRGGWGYRYADGHLDAADQDWPAEMREALRTGKPVVGCPATQPQTGGDGPGTLTMPLKVRDQTVGVLAFRKAHGEPGWTERETRVLELLVAELGDALVGAQLYEAAQSDALRQQVVGELATRMRQTLDVEAVLRTAAADVREALGLSEVVVRLRTPTPARVDVPVRSPGDLPGSEE